MNSNIRILPHLNICYLQKKAYDAHRKKIDSIKQSLKTSLTKKASKLHQNHSTSGKMDRKQSPNKMRTIKQQCAEPNLSRMKPANRRKYFDQLKQNQRLFKRIETCQSTISRRLIESHKLKSEQLRNRISKFKNDPTSHKSQLKSAHSLQLLQKLRMKGRQRDLSSHHNQNSISKPMTEVTQIYQRSKSLITNQAVRSGLGAKTQVRQSFSKQSSVDKLMAIRHTRKVQSHFGGEQSRFKSGEQKGVTNEICNSVGNKSKRRTEVGQNFWKSRCFTTQLERY